MDRAIPATSEAHSAVPAPPEDALPAGLRRAAFRAMGTTISLVLPAAHADAGLAAVRALFAAWERCLSRFQPESELSRLNCGGGRPTSVSALLFTVLTTALAAAQATDGIYDPTLLNALVRLGYDRSFEQLPALLDAPRPAAAPPTPAGGGWRRIQVDRAARRVTLPVGVALDFGGIAKGMAVDAAIARLRELGVPHALVNAGGDLAVLGLPPGMDAWPITIEGRDTRWTVPLRSGALATSGIGRRHWRQGEHERHHLNAYTRSPHRPARHRRTLVGDGGRGPLRAGGSGREGCLCARPRAWRRLLG